MKKIPAMTISLILIISILLPVASACEIPTEIKSNGLTALSIGSPEDAIILEKTIKNDENWVNTYNTHPCEKIRFRIKVTYHDWDGEPSYPGETNGYMLKDITITDILPSELEYKGNSNYEPSTISTDKRIITWDFYDLSDILYDGDSIIVEFDAMVMATGTFVNNVEVNAIESCYGQERNASAQATVISECDDPDCYDTRYKDVDGDGNLEEAIDKNVDFSDGYEFYKDPDGSSNAVKSLDGDGDGKIDHFIDIGTDNGQYLRYWDPDDNILSNVFITDVDYDGTYEWVYDSNGDGKPDKYYDPNDEQIHPYIVFTLTINIEGEGTVIKNPDGELFLEGFTVDLEAVPLIDSDYVFDHWSGDLSSDNSTETIVMNENKTITAHFTGNGGEKPTVKITKPEANHLYFFNIKLKELDNKTEIIGPITIKVKAESDNEIEKVEFYINGELKHTDNYAPYTWLWLFKPKGEKENFTISVKAYDKEGNNNTDSINVIRSQFTPIRDHKRLAAALVAGLGITYLLRNRNKDTGEEIPVEPDDGDGIDDDSNTLPENDTTETDDGQTEPSDTTGGEEDGLFWYIVSGLGTTITTALGLLFFRRKIYV
jgi:hypothetical protein